MRKPNLCFGYTVAVNNDMFVYSRITFLSFTKIFRSEMQPVAIDLAFDSFVELIFTPIYHLPLFNNTITPNHKYRSGKYSQQ